MGFIASFRLYLGASFPNLTTYFHNAFVGHIFNQKHTNVIGTVNVDQAAHIASLIGDETAEDQLAVQIGAFFEHFSAGPDDIVRNGWPLGLGKRLQVL